MGNLICCVMNIMLLIKYAKKGLMFVRINRNAKNRKALREIDLVKRIYNLEYYNALVMKGIMTIGGDGEMAEGEKNGKK